MTLELIFLVGFGLLNTGLLAGIFQKIGGFEATVAALKEGHSATKEDIRALWTELNKFKDKAV